MKMENAPKYLSKTLQYDFRLHRITTTAMQRSPFYKGLNSFNSLLSFIKNESNANIFKPYFIICKK